VKWSAVFLLFRRELETQLGQVAFAFLGIAVGVGLFFAVQVSSTSLSATIDQVTRDVVGKAQFQVVGRDAAGFSERVAARIAGAPGVVGAAPVLEAQANVVGARGARSVTLMGVDARLLELGGGLFDAKSAAQLQQLDGLVLPQSVASAIGAGSLDSVELAASGRSSRQPVAVVDREQIGALVSAPVVVARLGFAQGLADMRGRISRVYVRAAPGRERMVETMLRRVAGQALDVEPANFDERVFSRAALANDQSTALFAKISALVGFLFALNAMLLMTRERRQFITDLMMSGAPLRAVLRILALSALILGFCASAVGLLLGVLLSRHVFPPAPGYLTLAFPIGTARVVHTETIVVAVASGIAAAIAGTAGSLWMIFGRPIDEIEDDDLDRPSRDEWDATTGHLVAPSKLLRPRRLLFAVGVVCALVTVIGPLANGRSAMFAVILLVVSMLMCLPMLLTIVLTIVERLLRPIKSSGPTIAIGELRSSGTRSVTLVAIAAIAVFGRTAMEGARADLQNGLDADVYELNTVTDLWVSPAGASNALATTPFRPDAISTIARLPGVVAVDIQRGGFLNIGDRRVWITAPPRTSPQPIPPSQILAGDLHLASDRLRQHGWAAVSQVLVDEQHLRIAQPFTLNTPRGPTTFRLAAVTTNLGWTPGAIIINADDYRQAWNNIDASALHVRLNTHITPAHGKRLVEHALQNTWGGLTVETAADRTQRQRETARQGLARLTQIASLVLGAAALAMAIAITSMVWHRRIALARIKLDGTGREQVWRMVLLEAGLLLTIGSAIGAIYGLWGAHLLDRWLISLTGFPVQSSIAIPIALTSLAAITVGAFITAAPFSHTAARVPTAAAFQD
jgi:putative ABC transport system permease protein